MVIKNINCIVNNATSLRDRKARKYVLMGLEAALEAADPKFAIKSRLIKKGNLLIINGQAFNLKNFDKVFVVGGGKAGISMAEALEELLGDRITDGILNVPNNHVITRVRRIRLKKTSHPIPNKAGVLSTKQMLNLVSQGGDDLVICLISGGGSSLMPLPRGNISLKDKIEVTKALLNSGASINEINTVRKHISNFKGGWLAKKAYPKTMINLVLSDVLGDPLDVIASGPSVPDPTTFHDAIRILDRNKLWDKTPESVKEVLIDGKKGVIAETPKKGDKVFKKVYNFVVGNNRLAILAAYNKLQKAGLNTLLVTSYLEGEAKHVGTMLAAIAKEIDKTGNPIPRPACLIFGGETTVTVKGKGVGGRNQEMVLGASFKMHGLEGVAVGSSSTDGIDGPTNAAGAVADGKTIPRSIELGLDAKEFLIKNDSHTFFSKLGDVIFTGMTGTNVNDVSIIVAI